MTTKYNLPARVLHWLTALGIAGAFGLALSFDEFPLGPTKIALINYHKWIGITVLALVAIRLVWRHIKRPPAPLASLTVIENRVSLLIHGALYLLMFAVPLGGWLYSNAKGYPVVWLGLVPLPNLLDKNPALADTLKDLHELGGWSIVILAGLHATAALKHHFISKDDVLKRML